MNILLLTARIAYSGTGRISKVMVSADGGRSWAEAALQEPVLSKAFTRFCMPWHWDGGTAILQSRSWDEAGNVQPTRARICRDTRGAEGGAAGYGVSEPALQRRHQLGCRPHRGNQACLRVAARSQWLVSC